MWSRTASVLTVCRSQYRFHFYCIVFVGFLVLAGLSIPARSQEQAISGYTGFADESTSERQSSKEGSLSELTDGGRFELLGSMGGKGGPIAFHEEYAYVSFGQTLTVLNASDPTKLKCVKRITRPGTISAIITAGELLIVGDQSGEVCVYALVDPTTPVWLNRDHPLTLGGPVRFTSFFVQENTLYAYWGGTLFVVDLTDPAFPKVTGSCDVSNLPTTFRVNCQDIWVEGRYAFLVNREIGSLVVVDLQQGANPVVVTTKVLEPSYNRLYALQVKENMVYGLGRNDYGLTLFCIEISNPLSPEVVGSVLIGAFSTGFRDFAIQGKRALITGQNLHLVDVSDPTEPLRYMIETEELHTQYGRSAFLGDTLFVTSTETSEIRLIDWSRHGHPRTIGVFRDEPYAIESVGVQANTVFMSSNNIWIVDVSEPEDLYTLYQRTGRSNPRPLRDGLMLATYAGSKSAIYDVSVPATPTVLSTFDVILSGDVVYEEPYLYGVSKSAGLTVVDLQEPSEPVVLFRASPSGTESWAEGVFKAGNCICVHRNSSDEGLFIYDITQPSKPVLARYTSTDVDCVEIAGAGKNLFLRFETGLPTGPWIYGYDLTDPIHPHKVSQISSNQFPTALEISSGLLYIGTIQPSFQVFDITSPASPRELITRGLRPGSGTISEIVASNSRLYVAEGGGLSIYRHILPNSTEVTFNCAGMIHQDTRELHFKIYMGEPPEGGCSTSSVIDATPLVDCRLGCPYITSEGMVACDETPFNLPPVLDCGLAVNTWLDTVVKAIDDQAGDVLRVTRTSPNGFSLESIQPFYGTLCGEELGVSCDNAGNRLLNDCPIHNLMDGVDGNENQAETGGFGIVWNKHVDVNQPTVTQTPSSTRTPIPTFTFTQTETDTPTHTATPTETRGDGRFERVASMGGVNRVVALTDGYAYAGIGLHLTVLDIGNPAELKCVKRIRLSYPITAMAVNRDILIVGDQKGMVYTYRINDPRNPILLNGDDLTRLTSDDNPITSILLQEETAYLTSGIISLAVLDISNPSHPKVTGTYHAFQANGVDPAAGLDVCVAGDRAYLAVNSDNLHILNLNAGTNPTLFREYFSISNATSVEASGETVYVIGSSGLYCLDVKNQETPFILGSTKTSGDHLHLMGDSVITWGPFIRLYDISDPRSIVGLTYDPLPHSELDPTDPLHPFPSAVNQAVNSGTMTCVSRDTGDILFIDWSEPFHPEILGAYSEPVDVEGLLLNGTTLHTSGRASVSYVWNIDVSDIKNPKVLSEMQPKDKIINTSMAADESLLVTGSYNDLVTVYDISNLNEPRFLSTIPISMYGQMAYDRPFLYVSPDDGILTIIDLTDPSNPFIAYEGIPDGQDCSMHGVAKKADYVYVTKGTDFLVYNVSDPVSPTQVFNITGKPNIYESSSFELLSGKLFLGVSRTSSVNGEPRIFGFDILDPAHPKLCWSFPLIANPGKFFAISAGIAYVQQGTLGIAAHDFTSSNPLHTMDGTRVKSWGCTALGPYIISAEGEYGLSIYRHILPATPTEVTFTCAGLVHQDTRELHFKIFAGNPPENDCNTSSIISATPLVDCRLGCPYITSEGIIACNETPFNLPPVLDCGLAVNTWLDTVVQAIDDQAGDVLRVTRTSPNSFSLESIQPFYGTLCGEEIGVSCDNAGNRLLNDCPIHNLMDGVDGNESQAESGGFGIVWKKHVEPEEPSATVTPSPTAIPSDTPLVTPSFTETATGTPPPTLTEIPTPTVTQTMEGDVIPDGEINVKDLLEVLRQMEDAAETGRSGLLFDFSRVWKP